jgi:DNA-binding transcriptional MerR regulator/methylmalonyl-CoA mutase cobalamin-binding subunit
LADKDDTFMRTYPIRAVARLTGISIDTLRAWERRYQAVVPERGERGRVYRDADVERLRSLDALVRRGHAIGTIAHLKDRELASLLARPEPTPPAAQAIDLSALIAALDRLDLPAIDSALSRFSILLPSSDFIEQAVLPLMREVGVRWQAGTLAPAQEHLVSAIVRTVLGGLLRTSPRGSLPIVVFATPQGERHELGLLAAAVLSAQRGFNVIYLGPDLPAQEIAEAANRTAAAGIVMSVTIVDAHEQIARIRTLARKADIFIGGAEAAGLRTRSHVHQVSDVFALAPLLLQRLQ